MDDKLTKKKRAIVTAICNKLSMQFGFGNIKTRRDLYIWSGQSAQYIDSTYNAEDQSRVVTADDLKQWQKKLRDDLEASLKEPTPMTPSETHSQRVSGLSPTVEQPKASAPLDEPVKGQDEPLGADENYGYVPSPLEKCYLYYTQKQAVVASLKKIVEERKRSIMIIGTPGCGKTFVLGSIFRHLRDVKWEEGKTYGVSPYLYVTRSTVVQQSKEDLLNFSLTHPNDVEVINIEQLRSRAGENWITERTVVQEGDPVTIYDWRPLLNPAIVAWDECQYFRNMDTVQGKIGLSYNKIVTPTTQIYCSATPFGRISEAKAFCISTNHDISHLGFPQGTTINESSWPTFAALMAGDKSTPEEYNEAAMERLEKEMSDYIVRIKNAKWQFKAKNKVEIIDFQTDEERKEYEQAWERYLIRKAKAQESVTDNPRFKAMVELGQFLAAAEYCKREIFARRMYEDVQAGYAAVMACKFKKTIIAVTKILVEKYGVSRDLISLVWGGGQTQLTAKQKMKAQVEQNMELFASMGITMEDLMLEEVESRTIEELPENLRLGTQSLEARQKEIDRFKRGKSLYCIFTYKAGGVGLSLPHSDKWTTQKVRRKANGYAYVEDIPNIPVRQRKVTIGPTWSAIDLAQGSGRVPRLISLSDTEQSFLYYRGTVEESQAFVVMHKLKCIGKVVKQRESWTDLIDRHAESYGASKRLAEDYVNATKSDEKDDGQAQEEAAEIGSPEQEEMAV